MIIATIAALMILLGGGDSLEDYLLNINKPVKVAVENKVTVDEVLDLSKELGKQLKAQNKKVVKLTESFLDLHTEYDAKPVDIEAYIDKMFNLREEGQKQILDTRFAMKNLMTQEEWIEVFSLKDE